VPIQSYRDLDAWKIAMDFVVVVYGLTQKFPQHELYALTSQLRRAAVAVPSNISEGNQQGPRAYLRHVVIALGSLGESETQIEIARRLKYISDVDLAPVEPLARDLRRVLFGLRRSLRARRENQPPS
jgi:four helix bundle protein